MHAHSRKLTYLCGACALTGAALTGTAALAEGQPAPSVTALAAHLALGPSVVGRDAVVSLRILDRSPTAALGRLAVGAELPGGVAYLPHSVTLHRGDHSLAISAPHVVLQAGAGSELVWTGLPAGHEPLVLDFSVQPTGRAGSTWSSFVAVSEDRGGVAARTAAAVSAAAGPMASGLATVTTARATAHVEPLAVATSRRAGLETIVVAANPERATTDVVVRAYLPAGVRLHNCRPGDSCVAPVVTRVTLPTMPAHPKVPMLAAPVTTASAPVAGAGVGAVGTSTAAIAAATPPATLPATLGTSGTSLTAPPPPPAPPPAAARPRTGPEESFTVLTWRLGTVRAGARVTERFAVYAGDHRGPRGSWLVTATGRIEAGDATAPAVALTVDHLASWKASTPDHKKGSPPSTPPTTVPDPFGSGGNGSSSGSGSGSTTTTTTPPSAAGSTTTTTVASSATTTSTGRSSGSGSTLTATSLPLTGADAQLELEIAMAALLLGAGVVATTTRPRRQPRLALVTPDAAPVSALPSPAPGRAPFGAGAPRPADRWTVPTEPPPAAPSPSPSPSPSPAAAVRGLLSTMAGAAVLADRRCSAPGPSAPGPSAGAGGPAWGGVELLAPELEDWELALGGAEACF
ncbi:MAG: hypothetical protein ACYCUG_16585, partial [Acidimicrobiales bacterium]